MTEHVNVLTAVVAGVVSFLSPCVLPLIPGYISFVSGVSLQELQEGRDRSVTRRAVAGSLWFVAGFTLVFVVLGASATVVGAVLLKRLAALRIVAGAIIVLLGLHLMGILRVPALYHEKRLSVKSRPMTAPGAVVVGAAFAFGWTPCIGPILAGVLALAATEETVVRGMGLLAVYSLGLGVPFVLTSLGVERFLRLFTRFRRYMRVVEIMSGGLLLVIGGLIMTNRLGWLAQYLTFFNRFTW